MPIAGLHCVYLQFLLNSHNIGGNGIEQAERTVRECCLSCHVHVHCDYTPLGVFLLLSSALNLHSEFFIESLVNSHRELIYQDMRNNNIEVYIKCENRALPEYQVEVVDDKTVACYIPSEAGKVSGRIIILLQESAILR